MFYLCDSNDSTFAHIGNFSDLTREKVPVPLDDVAQRQEIPRKYPEIVVKLLVGGKLVKGASGRGGGKIHPFSQHNEQNPAKAAIPIGMAALEFDKVPNDEINQTDYWQKVTDIV